MKPSQRSSKIKPSSSLRTGSIPFRTRIRSACSQTEIWKTAVPMKNCLHAAAAIRNSGRLPRAAPAGKSASKKEEIKNDRIDETHPDRFRNIQRPDPSRLRVFLFKIPAGKSAYRTRFSGHKRFFLRQRGRFLLFENRNRHAHLFNFASYLSAHGGSPAICCRLHGICGQTHGTGKASS